MVVREHFFIFFLFFTLTIFNRSYVFFCSFVILALSAWDFKKKCRKKYSTSPIKTLRCVAFFYSFPLRYTIKMSKNVVNIFYTTLFSFPKSTISHLHIHSISAPTVRYYSIHFVECCKKYRAAAHSNLYFCVLSQYNVSHVYTYYLA